MTHDNDAALCPVCYLNACDCVVCAVCDSPVRVDPRTGSTGLCWRGHRWAFGRPTYSIELRAMPPVPLADLAGYAVERGFTISVWNGERMVDASMLANGGVITADDARALFGLPPLDEARRALGLPPLDVGDALDPGGWDDVDP